MGFLSHRRRHVEVRPEQKWDYINLNDFKASSCFTPFAYGYLWFSLLLSCAVYGVDSFTAVNLLAFQRWSSEVKPPNFEVTKWIFAICIILSVVNLAYEHIRAYRVMSRGSVAESFLDNLAVRLESIRLGKAQGWKRFLVFAALTESKKGAEYVALFTYFSFQSWVRVILCSGPRQVINGLTLYNVYTAKLSIQGNTFESSVEDFFDKIKALAQEDYQQAVILSGMLFTVVIWIFSFLSLLLAALFFILYLWHHIPREDGGLTGFCERKVTKRLMQIVSHKIDKAMAEEERRRKKAEMKAAKKNGGDRPVSMKATLPNLDDDSLPPMPISRSDTLMTLPAYSSRPNTPGGFELNSLEKSRPAPSRTTTGLSQYSSSQPLLNAAASPGYAPAASPAPSLPQIDFGFSASPRNDSPTPSNGYAPQRAPAPQRTLTNQSGYGAGYNASPSSYFPDTMPTVPSPLYPGNGAAGAVSDGYRGFGRSESPRPTYDAYSNSGRASPAPSGMGVAPYRASPASPLAAPVPMRSATGPVLTSTRTASPAPQPQRNMTAPTTNYMPQQAPHLDHRPTASNSSLRAMTMAASLQGSSADSGFSRLGTPNANRTGTPQPPGQQRPGYGNGGSSGWSRDVEQGPGPRY